MALACENAKLCQERQKVANLAVEHLSRKIPAIKRDAQSTAYGTIGVNGQNAALLVAATYPYGQQARAKGQ